MGKERWFPIQQTDRRHVIFSRLHQTFGLGKRGRLKVSVQNPSSTVARTVYQLWNKHIESGLEKLRVQPDTRDQSTAGEAQEWPQSVTAALIARAADLATRTESLRGS